MADYDEPISDQEQVGFNGKYDPYAMTWTVQQSLMNCSGSVTIVCQYTQ